MKIRTVLKVQQALGATIPSDMCENNKEYYSVSKKEWIPILDMEIIHFIRAAVKQDAVFKVEKR